MSNSLERCPSWSEMALQGLAFWIGHRCSLYPNYPLGESALVAETCNLIYANLVQGEVLLCEQQYVRMMPIGAWPRAQGARSRADLTVVTGLNHADAQKRHSLVGNMSTVIELKRASAPKAMIDQDLKRLAIFKRWNPKVRAFLFVVAEAHRPRRFVTPDGKAIPGKHDIPGDKAAHYRVRRVCKAAAAFSGKESAHYACIIEVFT